MRQLLLNPASSIGGDAIDALCEKVGKTSRQGRQRRHTKELARGNGGSIINSVECLVRLFDLGIDFGVGSQLQERFQLHAGRDVLLQHLLLGRDLRLFRSEEHTSELQSLMRISYAVFCLTKKKKH